ncbi:MAG: MBL fold metallo-hydrolase [Planctomycetota bacterium]|nr:MAG: MBL fold metallo-hydrolase [Planctomycetota bacterium]
MKIDRLILGEYETNCYILRDSKAAKNCLIIDTGLQAQELIDFLHRHKLNPVAVVLTHGHVDHTNGLALLRAKFPNIQVYIHRSDAEMLTGTENNLSTLTSLQSNSQPADILIEEGNTIKEAGIRLEVLHTPGHTPGGISLYSRDEGIVFVGDTLFAGSVGRADLGGNMTQLIKSIREKLLTLPEETIVYPGHGPITTIAQEKANNPFLQ